MWKVYTLPPGYSTPDWIPKPLDSLLKQNYRSTPGYLNPWIPRPVPPDALLVPVDTLAPPRNET